MTAVLSPRQREILVSVSLVAAVACILLGVWEFIVWKFDLPKALLPTPRQCWNAAVLERVALFRATISTGFAAFSGLLVAVAVGAVGAKIDAVAGVAVVVAALSSAGWMLRLTLSAIVLPFRK